MAKNTIYFNGLRAAEEAEVESPRPWPDNPDARSKIFTKLKAVASRLTRIEEPRFSRDVPSTWTLKSERFVCASYPN
jgi:hypothetical protein